MSQLKKHILSFTQEIIPRMDVPLIYDRLSKINLVGEEVETKHIRSIGERKTERETTLNEQKCPLCGGTLKLRKGRYGAFYGCSNYPKCRYTLNVRQ